MFFKYQQPSSRMFREDDPSNTGGGNDDAAPDPQIAALAKQLEDSQADVARLTGKITEANKHAKKAEKDAAEADRLKNEQSGNFELLHKAEKEGRIAAESTVAELQEEITGIKLSDVAGTVALKLNPLEHASKDLKNKITRRLKHTEDGVKVLDKSGNLTVSTLDQLAEELRISDDVSYMLKGNQSSGGGANKVDNSGGSAKEKIRRADFDALDPLQQSAKMKAGAVVIN